MRTVLHSASGIVLLFASAMAMAQGSGSITIDGKTIALPHARAWVGDKQMGMPLPDVILSEKPLKDLKWSELHEALTTGKQGVALRLKPSLSFESRPADATLKYLFDQSTNTWVHATLTEWNAWPSDLEGITATDFSVSKGVVRGKVEWKGSNEGVYMVEGAVKSSTITAWSADFTLPLEQPPPTP